MIVNNKNKFVKIYRHGLVAKISKINETKMKTVENVSSLPMPSDIDFEQINVTHEFRPQIENLIFKNRNLFAKDDTSLGQTDVVKYS